MPRINILSPLGTRNYRLWWIGSAISLIGDNIQTVALPALVLSITNNPEGWATVLAVLSVPRTILMLTGGAVVDRFHPKRIMILTNILLTLEVLTLSVLVFTGFIRLWNIYVCSVVYGILSAFSIPASQSLIPELVPMHQVRPANALMTTTSNLARSFVPLMAGGVILLVGSSGAFLFNCVTFIICTVFIRFVQIPRSTTKSLDRNRTNVIEGIRAVREMPEIWAVVLLSATFFSIYGGTSYVGLPAIAKLTFLSSDGGLGIVYSSSGFGALVGAVVIGSIQSVRKQGTVICTSILGTGTSLLCVSISHNIYEAAPFIALSGAFGTITTIMLFSVVQTRAPAEVRGRVISLLTLSMFGVYPISYALAGLVGDLLGARLILEYGGGLIIFSSVFGFSLRRVRTLTSTTHRTDTPELKRSESQSSSH